MQWSVGLEYQRHRQQKQKIDKWDYIKLKIFYTAKETINRVEKATYRMEQNTCKSFIRLGIISKVYKELPQFNTKKKKSYKTDTPDKMGQINAQIKMGKGPE